MIIDTEAVSQWFVRLKGFKVYAECPHCSAPQVEYFRARKPGYHGFAAQCVACERKLPVRFKHHHKKPSAKKLSLENLHTVIEVDFGSAKEAGVSI